MCLLLFRRSLHDLREDTPTTITQPQGQSVNVCIYQLITWLMQNINTTKLLHKNLLESVSSHSPLEEKCGKEDPIPKKRNHIREQRKSLKYYITIALYTVLKLPNNLGMNSNLQKVAYQAYTCVLGFSGLQHKKKMCVREKDLSDFLLCPVATAVTMYVIFFFNRLLSFLPVFLIFCNFYFKYCLFPSANLV